MNLLHPLSFLGSQSLLSALAQSIPNRQTAKAIANLMLIQMTQPGLFFFENFDDDDTSRMAWRSAAVAAASVFGILAVMYLVSTTNIASPNTVCSL